MERNRYDLPTQIIRDFPFLNGLIRKLIEENSMLKPPRRTNIKQFIRRLLNEFELKGKGREGAEGLLEIRERLNIAMGEPFPNPPGYLSKEEFERNLQQVLSSEMNRDLPWMPTHVKASGVAKYGQYEWPTAFEVLEDSLYELGKIMTVPNAYRSLFPKTDAILVGKDWHVENGIYRCLVLRALGQEFVNNQGMNAWVEVQRKI